MDSLYDFVKPFVDIPKKHLVDIRLVTNKSDLNSFEAFLLTNRVRLFYYLALVLQNEKEFVVVYEENNQADFDNPKIDVEDGFEEEQFDSINLGLGYTGYIYDAKQVCSDLLATLGFEQIICEHVALPTVFQKKPPYDAQVHSYKKCFMATDGSLILGEEQCFGIEGEYESVKAFFKTQMQELFGIANAQNTVPHSLYIDWLQKWYPGIIKMRMLD